MPENVCSLMLKAQHEIIIIALLKIYLELLLYCV